MSPEINTGNRPVRYLDSPDGLKVYLLGTAGEGYVRVENARTGRKFETRADRLHSSKSCPPPTE